MKALSKMKEVSVQLEEIGFEVHTPSMEETSDYSTMSPEQRAPHKNQMIVRHLERIKESDAILVVNENLKGIAGYVGANSFLEMGFAFALNIPIFLLNHIPDQSNKDELLGLYPIELNGDINLLK